MKIIKKFVLIACPLTLLITLLAGCHTVHGMGRDVSAAGHIMSEAARDDKDY